ncbi:MAG: glycoside hydrolase family 18 protein [Saprospiraceae bacterium]|nr:glycoside hydrolase family 18 protein [Saprospiraceae bacterium]MDW8228634.1 glycoside hydrolase family 18 protein [Saprospiraceae bacterium]
MRTFSATFLWLYGLSALSLCGLGQPPRHFITGYYPGWRAGERNGLVTPATLAYAQYDIIIYAFLNVEANGSLSLIEPLRDKVLLLGPLRANTPPDYLKSNDLGNPTYHQPGQRFADYAHRHRVRLMVSVGGWAHSKHFPTVAADPVKRARFAADCARAIELYHLDGIDLDWEYPGDSARNGSPNDRNNFTALLREVRNALDALRPQLRRDLMLTIACGAAPKHLAAIDWQQTHRLVNAIHLMTYSFYGQWDVVSNHNAPLFPPANATQAGYSCAEAVQTLLDYGVPPAKINLGLAFYGRSYRTEGTPGLHVQTSGQPDSERFARNSVTPLYYEITRHLQHGTYSYHWDDTAQAPYLLGTAHPSFVSFDDERSIALKAQYARLRKLRGAVIWDITGEYQLTADTRIATPLTDAIRRIFSGAEPLPDALTRSRVYVFPSTTYSGFIHIFTHNPTAGHTRVTVLDSQGKALHTLTFAATRHTIDMRALPPGTYRIRTRFHNAPVIETEVIKK